MDYINPSKKLLCTNVAWGVGLHECDVLSLTNTGYATEYEIKVSRSDILADKKKKHGHYSKWIKYLYFAVPYELVEYALPRIPKRAGLLSVRRKGKKYVVEVKKKPTVNKGALKWNDKKRYKLARLNMFRHYSTKKKLLKHANGPRNRKG